MFSDLLLNFKAGLRKHNLRRRPKLHQETSQESFRWRRHYLDIKNHSMSIKLLYKVLIAAIHQTWQRGTESVRASEAASCKTEAGVTLRLIALTVGRSHLVTVSSAVVQKIKTVVVCGEV